MKLIIPKKEMLIETNKEDSLDFYYRPIFSYIYRKKLRMCVNLLGEYKFNKVLEAGYGTGIFFLTLNKVAKEIYGIDEHKKNKDVMKKYKQYGLNLKLTSGDVSKLPYKDKTFDAIITMSMLEHISDLDSIIDEFHRVLEEEGYLFAGFPVKNKITDLFFKIATPFLKEKFDILKDSHVSSHRKIIKSIKKKFRIIKVTKMPCFLPLDASSYVCLKAQKI